MPPKTTRGGAAPRGRGAAPARGAAARGRGGATRGKPAGAAKPAAKAPAKPAEPPKPVWTEKDTHARKIQSLVRGFLARRRFAKKKQAKKDYDAEMDRLEKEAVLMVVRKQQEEAERKRQKEEEAKRLKMEQNKRRKRMLEAAFDGDDNEILAILKEIDDLDTKMGLDNDVIGRNLRSKHQLDMVDCEDPHGNTPVSEAAGGGQSGTVKMLLSKGANINSQGQFRRTPLYRAAFAGHLETCETLLEAGADPRIIAEDAQTPCDVAANSTVKELFQSWDMSRTEVLLEKLEKEKERRNEEANKRREAEIGKIENRMAAAQKEFEAKQKRLNKAYQELEKRIHEHDHAAMEGFDKPEITEGAIHDAEMELEVSKLDFDKAQSALSQIKLELREKKSQKEDGSEGEEENRPGITCVVRELDDVLLRDVGNRILESGKWPIIVDPSSQAATFLRYRDTNYVNALSPSNMECEKLRMAILGSLRYGKIFIIDMMEVDMLRTVAERVNEIQPKLMDKIMDKSIMKEENYLKLVRDSDGPEYSKNNFMSSRVDRFKFFLVVKSPFPSEELLETFHPVWVVVKE